MIEPIITIMAATGIILMLYRIQEKIGGLIVKVDDVIASKDDHESRITAIEVRNLQHDAREGRDL